MKKILALLFGFYTLLSWVVFFRFEWALENFAKYYPAWSSFFISTRQLLLSLYLNTIPTLLFAILILAAFGVYFLALKKPLTLKSTFFYCLLFQVIVLFSYPILSTDIYGYIVSDRLAVVHDSNVWTTLPNKFPNDKFFNFADYTDQVRIYGPVNQAIYTFPTMLSGDDIIVNVLVHKLVVIGFAALAFLVMTKLTKDPKALALVFWNPLFIIETAGSGHNDIIMLFFLLLGLLFFTNKRFLLSGILVALAVHVKTTPLLLLPFLGIYFIRHLHVKAFFQFFFAFLVTYFAFFLTMQTSFFALVKRQSVATSANWQSLPLILDHFAPIFSPLLKLLLPLVLFVQAVRTFLGSSPWVIFVETLLIYLLFFLSTLWNWYPLWILVLAPLVFHLNSKFIGAVFGLTFGALFAYVIYWTGQRIDYFQSPIWQLGMYGTILLSTLLGSKYARFSKEA